MTSYTESSRQNTLTGTKYGRFCPDWILVCILIHDRNQDDIPLTLCLKS